MLLSWKTGALEGGKGMAIQNPWMVRLARCYGGGMGVAGRVEEMRLMLWEAICQAPSVISRWRVPDDLAR